MDMERGNSGAKRLPDEQPDLKTIRRNLNEKYAGKVVTFKGQGRQYYLGKDGSLRRLDGKRERAETAPGAQPKDTRSPRQKRRERKRRAR